MKFDTYKIRCTFCKTWFISSNSNRKYCDNCKPPEHREKERLYCRKKYEALKRRCEAYLNTGYMVRK